MADFAWDSEELIGEFEKGKDTVLVHKNTLKGKEYVSIRVYYTDKDTNELKPTRKGITLQSDVMKDILYCISEEIDMQL